MQFECEVRSVKTCVDGSVNVTFNLPEYHVAEAQALLAMIGDLVKADIHLVGGKKDDQGRQGPVRVRTPRRTGSPT
jgi:hypothetical protein